MYNNLSQQTPNPYFQYNYGMPQFSRYVQQEAQTPTPQPTSMVQNFIKGRPVVSIDEARASQIDLDGSLYVFPDLGNKKIYTKQINIDGTATFNVFELATPVEAAQTPVYVTKDELDEILTNFKASLVQETQQKVEPAQNVKAQVNKPSFNL